MSAPALSEVDRLHRAWRYERAKWDLAANGDPDAEAEEPAQ